MTNAHEMMLRFRKKALPVIIALMTPALYLVLYKPSNTPGLDSAQKASEAFGVGLVALATFIAGYVAAHLFPYYFKPKAERKAYKPFLTLIEFDTTFTGSL